MSRVASGFLAVCLALCLLLAADAHPDTAFRFWHSLNQSAAGAVPGNSSGRSVSLSGAAQGNSSAAGAAGGAYGGGYGGGGGGFQTDHPPGGFLAAAASDSPWTVWGRPLTWNDLEAEALELANLEESLAITLMDEEGNLHPVILDPAGDGGPAFHLPVSAGPRCVPSPFCCSAH